MARDRLLFAGALAAARWPDELEKPDPSFRRPAGWLVVQGFVLLGWAGWGVFQGLMLLGWTVFRVVQFVLALPALLLFFFGGVWYAVWSFVRRPFPSFDEYIRSLLWCNTTPPISSRPWCCGTTLHPSLPSCCAGLFPSPFGRSGWKGGGAISRPSPSSRRGRFQRTKRPRPSSSGRSITRLRRGRIFSPSWLTIPGARTVYRRGDLRSRGIRENIGLHEPVCPPASRLASGQSAPSGGGAGARSQGRLLPRHPPNPGRGGPWTRLHRDWHGLPLSMESALGLVARFVLARLHRFELAQSVVRQGQGTLLAASLYQSGPLDHRASPRVPGPMGDVATGLPLRHRPGAIRGQDRGGGEAE